MLGRVAGRNATFCNHVDVVWKYLTDEYGEINYGPRSRSVSIVNRAVPHFNVKTSEFVYPSYHKSPVEHPGVSTRSHKNSAVKRRTMGLPKLLYPGTKAAAFHTNNQDTKFPKCTCVPRLVGDISVDLRSVEHVQVARECASSHSGGVVPTFHLAKVWRGADNTVQLEFVYPDHKQEEVGVTTFLMNSGNYVSVRGTLPWKAADLPLHLHIYTNFGFASGDQYVTHGHVDRNVCVFDILVAATTSVGSLTCLGGTCNLPFDGGLDFGLFRVSKVVIVSRLLMETFCLGRQFSRYGDVIPACDVELRVVRIISLTAPLPLTSQTYEGFCKLRDQEYRLSDTPPHFLTPMTFARGFNAYKAGQPQDFPAATRCPECLDNPEILTCDGMVMTLQRRRSAMPCRMLEEVLVNTKPFEVAYFSDG
jgi:hypothetical protein